MIRKLIKMSFRKLSDVSVGRVLKKLGFTPQKPLHKAYQKNEVLVNEWVAS
jgi:transposase